MKQFLTTLFLASTFFAVESYAGETISGAPQIVDSTTMMVAGKLVKLDYITSLKPGATCVRKNRTLDCGVLASAGLQDLVVGSSVVCRKNPSGKFTCTAGGYDLAYGLIHAGWAIPDRTAPARYLAKMNRAKQRKLGFWKVTNASGQTIAASIFDNR